MILAGHRRSIRITVLLITAIASLVTLSTGIVLVLSGMAAFRSTFELLSDTATLTIEAVESEVRGHVVPARQIVTYISGLIEHGDIDPANRQQMVAAMKAAMAAAPQIAGLVYWNEKNMELRVGRLSDGTVAAAPDREITDPGFLTDIARGQGCRRAHLERPGVHRWHDLCLCCRSCAARRGLFGGPDVGRVDQRALRQG